MRFSRNFTDYDFPIGQPHSKFITMIQRARNLYGRPIYVSSGGRTLETNNKVGGAKDSSHLMDADGIFLGADLKCSNSRDRFDLINAVYCAGFRRIGLYDQHIHIDADDKKDQRVMWVNLSK